MNSFLPSALRKQQLGYLSKRNGLYELFDRISLPPIFKIPQNSISVNLDNITFGPDRFTVTLPLSEQLYHKIVYYCILYYVFERNNKEKGEHIYIKLLSYIISSDLNFSGSIVQLSTEEIRIYLVKFMNLLWGGRFRNKVVIDELAVLPPIDILLTQLIAEIIGDRQFDLQKNGKKIESQLKEHLGIDVELLSYELFIIEGEYLIQIRQFNQCCEFVIIHENRIKIEQLRNQFYLGESAFFRNQSDALCGSMQTTMKRENCSQVTKKDTIKSIELQLQLDMEESHHFNDLLDFASAKNIHQFISNNACVLAESVQNQCDAATPNRQKILAQDEVCQSKQLCQQKQTKHRLTFNEIVNCSKMGKQSNQNIQANTIKGLSLNQNFLHNIQSITGEPHHRMILQKNKTQANIGISVSPVKLNASYSTTNIKSQSPRFVPSRTVPKHPQRKSKRVPSFVLIRQKAKMLNSLNSDDHHIQNAILSNTVPSQNQNMRFLNSCNK